MSTDEPAPSDSSGSIIDDYVDRSYESLVAAWRLLPMITDDEGRQRFWQGCRYEMDDLHTALGAALVAGAAPKDLSWTILALHNAIREGDIGTLDGIGDLVVDMDRKDPRTLGVWDESLQTIPEIGKRYIGTPEGWWNSTFIPSFPSRSYDEHRSRMAKLANQVHCEMVACSALEERIALALDHAKSRLGEIHHMVAWQGIFKDRWLDGERD